MAVVTATLQSKFVSETAVHAVTVAAAVGKVTEDTRTVILGMISFKGALTDAHTIIAVALSRSSNPTCYSTVCGLLPNKIHILRF